MVGTGPPITFVEVTTMPPDLSFASSASLITPPSAFVTLIHTSACIWIQGWGRHWTERLQP